jgi:hypothetical protein
MKTSPRASASALALLLLATSCATTPSAPAVNAVAADTATLIADIETAAQGQPLTSAQLKIIAGATAQLSTDVANLNTGTSGTTASSVLADVTTAVADVGQFLPSILALVSLAAPAPGTTTPAVASKALFDYQKLKSDVAAANKAAALQSIGQLALGRS